MRLAGIVLPLLLVALAAPGCQQGSEERVPVAGKVLIDGQPLTEGTIQFVPKSGRPASSAILADGSFALASDSVDRSSKLGVPRGAYRVQVSASKVVDEETVQWNAPASYADFRTSGLNVSIDEPTDDLLIELTWDGHERSENKTAPAKQEKRGPEVGAARQVPDRKEAPAGDEGTEI